MSTENSGENRGGASNLVPHRFQPGTSGNPGGRPKKLPITDYLLTQLGMPIPAGTKEKLPAMFAELYGEGATFGQLLAFNAIQEAAMGNVKALGTILDRVEGKVSRTTKLEGEVGGPIVFTLSRVGCKICREGATDADSLDT